MMVARPYCYLFRIIMKKYDPKIRLIKAPGSKVTMVEIQPDTTKPKLSYIVVHVRDPTDIYYGLDMTTSLQARLLHLGSPVSEPLDWIVCSTTIYGLPGLARIETLP
jgi:hypothetical protein